MPDFDVVIAGAGPAGSVAAIVLARQGHSVLLFDREHFPRNKPCGEGILPGGARVLQDLGLLARLLSEGASRIEQIGFHIDGKHPCMFNIATESAAFGIAMSRSKLDAILLEQAQKDGTTILQGARFESCEEESEHAICRFVREGAAVEARCRFFIDATGAPLRRPVDEPTRREQPDDPVHDHPADRARFGLSTHIPDLAPAHHVDVFIRDGYEIYTSSVESNLRIVSILCEPETRPMFAKGLREAYRMMVLEPARQRLLPDKEPDLPAWLAIDPEKIIGAGLESPRAPRWGTGRRINIGDSLVRTDPVAAQGLTLALLSGKAAARILADSLSARAEADHGAGQSGHGAGHSRKIHVRFRAEMTDPVRRSQRFAGALLFLVRRPRLARIAFRLSRHSNIAALADPLSSVTFFGAMLSCFMLQKRATEPEIMDMMNPDLLPRSTYRFLSFFNRYLGGERATVREILESIDCSKSRSTITPWGRTGAPGTFRLVDVGGGDGDMAQRLAMKLERAGVRVKPICIDPHLPRRKSAQGAGPRGRDPGGGTQGAGPSRFPLPASGGVAYIIGDIRRLPLRDKAVDFTVSSLLFHHLDDADIGQALRECSRSAKVSVIVNDLVRSFHGWLITSLVTALFGDRIVRHDGPLSVRKAFTRNEVLQWTRELDIPATGLDIPAMELDIPARSPENWSYRPYPFFRFVLTRR